RIYENIDKKDGYRILVDRLWPRGMKKEDADIDLWAKEVAPSDELRKWFHLDKEKRFVKFKERYQKELQSKKNDLASIIPKSKKITLITAAKDTEHSHITILKDFLEKNL